MLLQEKYIIIVWFKCENNASFNSFVWSGIKLEVACPVTTAWGRLGDGQQVRGWPDTVPMAVAETGAPLRIRTGWNPDLGTEFWGSSKFFLPSKPLVPVRIRLIIIHFGVSVKLMRANSGAPRARSGTQEWQLSTITVLGFKNIGYVWAFVCIWILINSCCLSSRFFFLSDRSLWVTPWKQWKDVNSRLYLFLCFFFF